MSFENSKIRENFVSKKPKDLTIKFWHTLYTCVNEMKHKSSELMLICKTNNHRRHRTTDIFKLEREHKNGTKNDQQQQKQNVQIGRQNKRWCGILYTWDSDCNDSKFLFYSTLRLHSSSYQNTTFFSLGFSPHKICDAFFKLFEQHLLPNGTLLLI